MDSMRGYVGLQFGHKRRLIAVEPLSDLINRPAREVLKGKRLDLIRCEIAGYGMVDHVLLHDLADRSSPRSSPGNSVTGSATSAIVSLPWGTPAAGPPVHRDRRGRSTRPPLKIVSEIT